MVHRHIYNTVNHSISAARTWCIFVVLFFLFCFVVFFLFLLFWFLFFLVFRVLCRCCLHKTLVPNMMKPFCVGHLSPNRSFHCCFSSWLAHRGNHVLFYTIHRRHTSFSLHINFYKWLGARQARVHVEKFRNNNDSGWRLLIRLYGVEWRPQKFVNAGRSWGQKSTTLCRTCYQCLVGCIVNLWIRYAWCCNFIRQKLLYFSCNSIMIVASNLFQIDLHK